MSFIVASIYDALVAHAEWLCLNDWRRDLVAELNGEVLEIGSGTGRNLEHYGAGVERLVLTEPDPHMRRQLQAKLLRRPASKVGRIELRDDTAELLSFPSASFDHVVATLVFCSVKDPYQSAREIHRLLRPGGQLMLIEHVLAPEATRRRHWQLRLNPIWTKFSAGCRLDRDPRDAIVQAGFEQHRMVIDELRGAPAFLRTVLRGSWRKPK